MTESKTIITTPSGKVEKKLSARHPDSELAKLKLLWRDSLSGDEKEFWRQQFVSPEGTNQDIRDLIREKLKVDLQHDRQLYAFREWELVQRSFDLKAERTESEKHRMMTEHPDWDMNRIREELLKETYIHTTMNGNYVLGLQAMRTDAQFSSLELNREKFKESLRAKIMAGIDALAEEAKKNPTVKAAVQQLRQAIAPE